MAKPYPRTRIGARVTVVCGALLLLVSLTGCHSYELSSEYTGARDIVYQGFEFYEDPVDGVTHLMVGGPEYDYKVAPLFLRLASDPDNTHNVANILESEVRAWAKRTDSYEGGDGMVLTEYYLSERTYLAFSSGKIVAVSVGDKCASISPAESGKFIELPSKHGTILERFGKPVKYVRKHRAHT